jgi:ketosteroid isomerase-like protein
MEDHGISEASVAEFLKRFEQAQGTQSFSNVVDMIHPDAIFRFNDGDYRGHAAIRKAFEETWAYDVTDERYHLADVEVMSTDADSATATFTFNWSGYGPDGPFHIVGRGTVVIVRHDGALKVAVEHLSR